MDTPLSFWIAFIAAVLVLLAIDLFAFNRQARESTLREAALWSVFWVALSTAFGIAIWQWKGPGRGIEFFTGYLLEYSLSVDNLFVFMVIFHYFAVPAPVQRRVLFWGILGALLLRGAMIGLGVALISHFDWVLYLLGIFLIFTGFKMLGEKDKKIELEKNPVLKLCRNYLPLTRQYEGARFLTRAGGKWLFTPLALVFIIIETTDLVFAVDSIPAVFAVTKDAFIVFTSNICAILGLRALYFLLAGAMRNLVYLPLGLGVILIFIGAKMFTDNVLNIPNSACLAVIVIILAGAIVASLRKGGGKKIVS
jgi:tellurite resistance protein TerC